MAVVAAIGFGIVVWVLSLPKAEKDQRVMTVQLMFAYQKYRFDNNRWPVNAMDAAEGFRSENDKLSEKVEKAEKEWGMKVDMIDADSESPMLKISFQKPSPFARTHALYKAKPRGAGSARVSASY